MDLVGTKHVANLRSESRLLDFREHFETQASRDTISVAEMISEAVTLYTQFSSGVGTDSPPGV